MKTTAFAICCGITLFASAQTAKFESVKLSDRHYSIDSRATDASGNRYETGTLTGQTDFDPGTGVYNLSGGSERFPDIFISKLNAKGEFVWAKKIGGQGYDRSTSLALDKSGNIYITGYYSGTKDFNPGDEVFELTGDETSSAGFILKLDATGNFLWAKKIGEKELTYGYSITLDGSGNIYTLGTFYGTVDFDSGEGVNILKSTEVDGRSKTDMFVLKMDASGNFLWAKNWYGGVSDEDHSIVADASGNVYTTGHFYGKTDFNPGKEKFYLTSNGKTDIFISKLDASGNFVWAKGLGGKLEDEGKFHSSRCGWQSLSHRLL